MNRGLDDDLVVNLTEFALSCPEDSRESYLQNACGGDAELLAAVRECVEWEVRMNGFLLKPLYSAHAADSRFKPGELLEGRFRIVREVAQGGMGVVYEALDERLDRRVAIKCAKPGYGQRLPPEVRNASEISHPNVCRIFEIHTTATEHGPVDFITMEFLAGETLASRLQRGKLPEIEARSIARQLCAGLAEAHRKRVIHGDLKSNNVILTNGANGSVAAVIMDFGLARTHGSSLRTLPSGEAAGTPAYMAPELWKGEKASTASDIYALGVILYELASGHRPKESPLDRVPACGNPKWDRVLGRCLDPNPVARFRTAEEVGRALGPSAIHRRVLYASAALALAIVSGAITYSRATAPAESVRLALLPFQADAATAGLATSLVRDAASRIVQVKGNSRTAFELLPIAQSEQAARRDLGATHLLQGSLSSSPGSTSVRAEVTDLRTNVKLNEWTAAYQDGQAKYAPAALAGVVTQTFHLPGLVDRVRVNGAAETDYSQGLVSVRHFSKVDAALASFERAVRLDPDSAYPLAGLAEAQWLKYSQTYEKSWLERADESVRQAQSRNPDLAAVHRVAGLVRVAYGGYEQGIAAYRRAIEIEPGNSDAHRRLGQALDRNGQFDAALAALLKAAELEPAYFRNQQSLGSLFMNRGSAKTAAVHFRRAAELAPDEPQSHYRLGIALKDSGALDEAEKELRTAIRLSENSNSLHALGSVLMYRGRDSEAIPYFTRALVLRPGDVVTTTYLGVAQQQSHMTGAAKRSFEKGVQLAEANLTKDPRSVYNRSLLAYLCAKLGNRTRAQSEIAQALRLNSEDSDTKWYAVMTYEALGLRESSLSVLATSTPEMLADASRWPVLKDLRRDQRFEKLLASRQLP